MSDAGANTRNGEKYILKMVHISCTVVKSFSLCVLYFRAQLMTHLLQLVRDFLCVILRTTHDPTLKHSIIRTTTFDNKYYNYVEKMQRLIYSYILNGVLRHLSTREKIL